MTGTPAGAHVASWAHNWKKHIKPRTDANYQQRLWAVVEDVRRRKYRARR